MNGLVSEIATAVTRCGPGAHEIPWGRFGGAICAPDVPGDGLPWDLPTALSAIGSLIFMMAVVTWLLVLLIRDQRRR